MQDLFEFARGMTAGRDHRLDFKNCQDAFNLRPGAAYSIGVVCDGCGSSAHSEVGAEMGARFIVEALARDIARYGAPRLDRVRLDVLAQMRVIVNQMGGSFSQTVNDLFLFTTVGFVLLPERSIFFSLGDGIIVVNGHIFQIGPFPDNAPPYLAYGLVESSIAPELLQFNVHADLPTSHLEHFLIGSDGVFDLISAAQKQMPGKTEIVDDLSQFWSRDRYFKNAAILTRQLRLINADAPPDWENRVLVKAAGLLADDTTLIVGRARKEKEPAHD